MIKYLFEKYFYQSRVRIIQNCIVFFLLQRNSVRYWTILSVARNSAKTGAREANSKSVKFLVTPDFGFRRRFPSFTHAVRKAFGDPPMILVYLSCIRLVQVII